MNPNSKGIFYKKYRVEKKTPPRYLPARFACDLIADIIFIILPEYFLGKAYSLTPPDAAFIAI